jgi:hypothetical protein
MMNTAIRRAMVPAMLCALVASCGRKAEPAKASDPNTPAVVKLPPLILPSDTAKPDTMQSHREKMNAALSVLVREYAVLGAATVFGDRRMIETQFAPDAVLVTSDSSYKGSVAIANALAALATSKSLREFNHSSRGFRIADSIVVDSGTYTLISKRAGADSLLERGVYVASWRMHAPPLTWVIRKEELRPGAKRRKKG